MIRYQRITPMEREEISRRIASGCSIRKIAQSLNRPPSTISREILCSGAAEQKYYRAIFAQQQSNKMRHKLRGNRKLDNNIPLREVVFYYLAKNWSPEQIAKRLIILYPNDMTMRVSHETIYSYVYVLPRATLKRKIISCLRRHHLHRRKKNKDRQEPGTIQDYLSIEERPQEVSERIIPGHWEGDLIIGRRNASAIGTLVERTTRMTFLVKLGNQEAMTVRKAFAEEFRQLPKGLKRTLTYDRGREMAQHKLFSKETEITVYFAHPHSPWERGSNENTNALIRQYFPKGTDFSNIPNNRLKEVQDELNDRPRKTLGFYTPHEKFSELLH
ncbi:MAG: IS30 family transposase [Candidatus Omnitrophica bacterium]|nr:IS30 family transposase [Candidatus Omnitrophota bacterium]MBU2221264.1 IS30 family transposase [Candidatus Omnitrophota bacterium]MBU2258964.1 IS30 family transposase [Candidatus Omnitrophota bacterium]